MITSSFFDDKNLEKTFSLTIFEIKKLKKINKSYLRLGYAIQFLFLKNKGISILSSYELVTEKTLEYVAAQIDCNLINFHKYWEIKNTKFRHFQEICNILKFEKFKMSHRTEKFIYNVSLSTGNNIDIVKQVIENLKINKIILPIFSKIEEIISKGIFSSSNFIYSKIYEQIENKKEKLEHLLTLSENGISNYSRIKNVTVNNSSVGVKELLSLIKEIDTYGQSIDMSFLSENKIKYFYGEIQRSDRFRIEKFHNTEKKYAFLAMFLNFRRKEFVDMIIEVTSYYANTVMKRTKKKTKNYFLKNQQKYKTN